MRRRLRKNIRRQKRDDRMIQQRNYAGEQPSARTHVSADRTNAYAHAGEYAGARGSECAGNSANVQANEHEHDLAYVHAHDFARNTQKCVVLGVSACVAIYKACELIRQLQKRSFDVRVVMTEHATHFIDPTMFRALTKHSVAVGLFDKPSDPIHHISLARMADVFVIAPATMNVIAKVAAGIADDILTTSVLATSAPLVIAPAANSVMYEAPISQDNRRKLAARGVRFVEADAGELACGEVGKGRMAEPASIVEAVCSCIEDTRRAQVGKLREPDISAQLVHDVDTSISSYHSRATTKAHKELNGKHVLITAGPTHEYIDPVRFIGNPSSGKMGFCLAQAARRLGARVELVSGPTNLSAPEGVELIRITSAQEMFKAVQERFSSCDVALFSAAVSDFRPLECADHKLKKANNYNSLTHIDLVENPDILQQMGAAKTHQIVVGFAAETSNVIPYAREKLVAKHADMIVANKVSATQGFACDTSQATLVLPQEYIELPEMPKIQIAEEVFHVLVQRLLSFA